MVTDPVCGMSIEQREAPAKSEFQGTTYFFCSPECKRAFQHQPRKYAKAERVEPAGADRAR